MDYEHAKMWIDLGQFIITGMIGVYLWWERNNDRTQSRIEGLKEDVGARLKRLEIDSDTRMDDHSARLAKIETRVDQLPGHEHLGDLHDRINDMARGVNLLTGELSGVKTTLNLIHQHLLNGGKS